MAFEDLLTQFGYPALSIGTVIEGEAALIFGGILAKEGYFALGWVVGIAFLTTLACDQFFFFLGRFQGCKALNKWPKLQAKSRKITGLVHRNHLWLAVFFRFVYGFRSITPFTIGLCGITPIRFLILNLIGVSLWVFLLTSLGYVFGHALDWVLQSVRNWELWIIGGLTGAGLLVWGLVALRRKMVGKYLHLIP